MEELKMIDMNKDIEGIVVECNRIAVNESPDVQAIKDKTVDFYKGAYGGIKDKHDARKLEKQANKMEVNSDLDRQKRDNMRKEANYLRNRRKELKAAKESVFDTAFDQLALYEVKGEAEADYSAARVIDHRTRNNYGNGSKESKSMRTQYGDYYKNINNDREPMKNADDYRRRKESAESFKKGMDRTDKEYGYFRPKYGNHATSDGRSANSNDRKRARRAANESSIFDDLFDLV
jgi:hypothetical protein